MSEKKLFFLSSWVTGGPWGDPCFLGAWPFCPSIRHASDLHYDASTPLGKRPTFSILATSYTQVHLVQALSSIADKFTDDLR